MTPVTRRGMRRRIAHEQALTAADQIVIIAHMAAIRAEHMRTAVGLVGGSEALADLIYHNTKETRCTCRSM